MFKNIQEKILTDHGMSSVYLESISDIISIRSMDKACTLTNVEYLFEGNTEVMDLLNNVVNAIRELIKQLYQSLLEAFDYYILNEAVNLERYIDHIKKKSKDEFVSVRYVSYEFDKFDTYPKQLKTVLDVNQLIKKDYSVTTAKTIIRAEYLSAIENLTDINYGSIPSFAQIKTDFEKKMRGREINLPYNPKLLDEFLEDYKNAKKIKTSILEERNEALEMIKEIEHSLKELEKLNYDKNTDLINSAKYQGIAVDIEGKSKEINATLVEYNTFYSDLLRLIELLYTSKITMHRERLNSQKIFVLACLKEVNIVDMNKKRVVRMMTSPPLGVKGDKLSSAQADLHLIKNNKNNKRG